LQRVFELIALARVSTSAKEARKLGFLRRDDKITMNKDRLIADAKKDVLAMAMMGYEPPRQRKLKVTGRSGYAALQIAIKNFQWAKRITESRGADGAEARVGADGRGRSAGDRDH
jgi:3-hydroxyacyl-CoA dehydrogenase